MEKEAGQLRGWTTKTHPRPKTSNRHPSERWRDEIAKGYYGVEVHADSVDLRLKHIFPPGSIAIVDPAGTPRSMFSAVYTWVGNKDLIVSLDVVRRVERGNFGHPEFHHHLVTSGEPFIVWGPIRCIYPPMPPPVDFY